MREKVEPISQALNLHLSDAQGTLTLSQRALNFVTSSPGVSVVLNGMKREEYVEDAMQIMEMPDFSTAACTDRKCETRDMRFFTFHARINNPTALVPSKR